MEHTASHHLLAAHGLRRTAVTVLLSCVAVLAVVAAVAAPATAVTVLVTDAVVAAGRRLRSLTPTSEHSLPATPAK